MAIPHWQGGMGRESRATSEPRAVPGTRNLWAVVPAGGSGTRLWPLSRAARPKFLLPLLGERSLLQKTIDRLAPSVPPERTLVVCGPAHAAPVARQLPALPERNVLVEPSPRGVRPGDHTRHRAHRPPRSGRHRRQLCRRPRSVGPSSLRCRAAHRCRRRPGRLARHYRDDPDAAGNGLWLHRAHGRRRGRNAGGIRLSCRALRRKTGCSDRGGVCRLGPLPVECQHVRLASPARCSTKWRGFSRTCTLA